MNRFDGVRSRSRLLIYGAALIATTGLGIGFAYGAGSAGPATSYAFAVGCFWGLLMLGQRWTAEGNLSQLLDGGRFEFRGTLGAEGLAEPWRSQVRNVLTSPLHRYMIRLPIDLLVSETAVQITARPTGSKQALTFSFHFGLANVASISTRSAWHDQAGPGLTFTLHDGQKVRITLSLSAKQVELVAAELRRRIDVQSV
ncbi:MAG: hypothetical protein R2733_24470 [Acidimicrobiales bacterium]